MRILVTGASGQLGGYLLPALQTRGDEVVAWSGTRTGALFGCALQPVDLTDPEATAVAFRAARPEGVIHAAALSSIADCYRDPARAHRVNTQASGLLAELAERAGARFVMVSTDLVFDGRKGGYGETDEPAPLSVYGRSKRASEREVLARPGSVVVRMSLLYGPTRIGRPYSFEQQLTALREGRQLELFEDEWRTPLALTTAAAALRALVESDFAGLIHVGGPERLSRFDLGRRLAAALGLDSSLVQPAQQASVVFPEPRPRDVSLDSARWRQSFPEIAWPRFEEALGEMMA